MNDEQIEQQIQEKGKTTPGARVPWLASQTDMLAKDWVIVE